MGNKIKTAMKGETKIREEPNQSRKESKSNKLLLKKKCASNNVKIVFRETKVKDAQ